MKNNFVSKNMNKFNRSAVMVDRKKQEKYGKEKHKQDFKKTYQSDRFF